MGRPVAVGSNGATGSMEAARLSLLWRAILSGFIASVAMLFTFLIAYGVASLLAAAAFLGQPYLDPLRQWFAGLVRNQLIDLAQPNLYAATVIYLMGGLLWAVMYAYLFQPRLGGPQWRRGLVFALVPWLFSLLVFFPIVGAGVLGLALRAGPLPVVGNLILHAVYGVTLGEVYGPLWGVALGTEGGAPTPADEWANVQSQAGAAKGVLAGLALGAPIGLALVAVAEMAGGEAALGMHPLYFLPTTMLIGAALGALVGSFLGLSIRRPRA